MERRTPSRHTGLFLMLCAAMLLLSMVTQQPWAAGARGYAKGAIEPLEAGMMAVAGRLGAATSVLGDISSLRTQNQHLEDENASLRKQIAELSAAGLDNQALRQALEFQRAYGHAMVAAAVVGRGPDSFSVTVAIDRGTADGVRPGMVVASGAGLVGRVREAGPHVSIVQTVADPQSRVSAFLSKSGLQGTVIGGPGSLEMQIDPRFGIAPAVGEWVITNGVGGGYPRGLVVAQVASVNHSDASTLDEAVLAWVNDPTSLSVVLVITDFTSS